MLHAFLNLLRHPKTLQNRTGPDLRRMGVGSGMATKPEPRLIDNRNRIALTRAALDALGVESGDYVVLEVEDDGSVRLRRARIVVE